MKKLLLLFAAALTATGLNTAAAQFQKYPAAKAPQKVASVKNNVATASDKSLEISYCGDDVYAIGVENLSDIGAAIQVPASTAASYEGAKLTKVKIGLGQITNNTKITVFVAKRLNNMYTYKEQFDVQPLYADAETGAGTWVEYTLSEPYEITTAGFYVGYIITPTSSKDYPIGIDYVSPSNSYGNRVYLDGYGTGSSSWYSMTDTGLDCNVCVRAVVEGDALPGNEMELSSLAVPTFVKTGEAFAFGGTISNKGVNDVKSFEINYQLGDMAPVTKTIEAEIASGAQYEFTISDAVYNGAAAANIPATATITKVNGEEDKIVANNTASSAFWSGEKSFDRTVVVEEATSNTCGWCIRGIVGMEYMKETYPDSFIGIAAHFRMNTADPMETSSYSAMTHNSLPMAFIDRIYADDPNAEYLEIYYMAERTRLTFAKVDITNVSFNAESTKLTVDTKLEFAVDASNVDYRLAYVVLENAVGPYNQTNYYAGGVYGPMDGWESKSGTASTIYNDVARDIFDYEGVRNSVPANVAAGEKYDYSYTVDLRNVADVNNMEIAVLLIDAGGTGEILNARKLTSKEIAGVNKVEIELNENAPAVFYNLQGVQVPAENMAPGLYVKRQGNKAEKVIVR